MQLKQLSLVTAISALTFTTTTNAVLGPIPIYLNTEYRTESPVIGSIASTIQLNKADILKTGSHTFTELLATIGGITFEGGQGNLTALRIRGNEANHTLLLVDGSVVSISATQPNFDVVPLEQIERIEIIKGPFSSLYGPGAIGGVIHVFTNKESEPGVQSEARFSYGTHNTQKISVSSSANNNGNYAHYTLSKYHTDGIDATSNGDLDPIDRTSGSLNIGGTLSDATTAKLNILNTKADIEYDDSWSAPKPDNNLTQFNIEVNHQFNKMLNTKFDIMRQKTQRREAQYKLETLSIVNEYTLNNAKLSLGASQTTDKDVDNAKQIKHTDLFSQWQGVVNHNELSLGARVVDHDKFSKHNTYNINWAKNIDNNARITASFGKATNLPDHYQNNLNIEHGKTELNPEHSKNIELGISKNYHTWSVLAKFYKSKVTDAFKWSATGYTNEGTVNIKGIELDAKANVLGWDLKTNYDYNTAVSESTNLQKGRRPNHTGSITATKTQGQYSHRINLTGKSWAWDKDAHTNNDKLGGYGLLNLFTDYDYNKQISISVSLNNALDKQYEMAKGYNTLGRTVTLGIAHKF
ncbi:TonB-dependent receptor [Candidatus Thioglobus autotrophicus]|uniref:TonB-dependent receptor domain-containing protein n=1 Tax=Candidatus Thioglobus autotrophicus TaxID=1705394 RepID=UPI00299DC329|nr:TonB-dependent receptor [Candidatus Thioglobus autotrophicus]WPE17080.1 TonB-dependent receptor [Candidatus Thioglobus autotrophicus]